MQQNNKTIWPISLASFCWSFATLMAASVLPFYLTETLKISYIKVGYIEGIAIFSSFVAKIFSGFLSDWLQKRYFLILLGSIISIITKPMLALSVSYQMVCFSKSIDRFAKGIRSAPTDALIADLNNNNLSYAFGVRQTLYVLGEVFGASATILIMFYIGLEYKIIFYISSIPAAIAVVILMLFVKDPASFSTKNKGNFENICDLKKFSKHYWGILLITFFLMVARFSESFLSLRVKDFGWPVHLSPLIFIILNLSHAYFAFVSRKYVTKAAAEHLLAIGLLVLIMANITWFVANNIISLIVSLLLTGMHLGLTQGILRSLVANSVKDLYGSAFALFYLISGCGVLLGNSLAGMLADYFELATIFIGSMVAGAMALLTLLVLQFLNCSKKLFTN